MHKTENKYIIAETVDEQKEILQILENDGYQWMSGHLPTNYIPIVDGFGEQYVIYIHETYYNNKKLLQTGTIETLAKRKTKFVEITKQELRNHFRPKLLL